MNPFINMEWPEVRAAARGNGYTLVDGRASVTGTGYYPAKCGGGYQKDLVACSEVHQVVEGKPAYHGTVAFKA